MNSLVQLLEKQDKFKSYIEDIEKNVNPILLSGLTDGGKMHLAYSTKVFTKRPICVITYNEIQARKLVKDLNYYSKEVYLFPKREILSYDYLAESTDLLGERIKCLNAIRNNTAEVIITTAEAIMQDTVSIESLYKNTIEIAVGKSYSLDDIKDKLVKLGYERFELVEGKGQFSIRGGIIDIALSEKQGVRIELWGDEVDSIRLFSIYTQRSTEMLDNIKILPAYEFILEKPIEKICYELEKQGAPREDIGDLKNGNYINKIEKYFDVFYDNKSNFLNYLTENTIIFLDEINKIKTRMDNIIRDNEEIEKNFIEKQRKIPDSLKNMLNYEKFIDKLGNKQLVYLEAQDLNFIDQKSIHAKRNGYSFSYREVKFFRSGLDILFQELQKDVEQKKQIVILGGTIENSKKIAETLINKQMNAKYVEKLNEELINGQIVVTPGVIDTGFESFDFNFILYYLEEIFTTKKRKIVNNVFKDATEVVFSDLKIGDYVVHKSHGIGQFVGVNTIKADKITKDYIKIRYKNDDILYIPTNQLDNIRKYIGVGDDSTPALNSLGDKTWAKTTKKVKSNLREVAKELIELYAKRQKAKGFAFSKDTPWQTEFENSFQYVETDDQIRCIDEVKKDMETTRPMDRLLCGDVGYGKTEVAIRAAFKACMDQKQVAYLVPTTILAQQQYQSFKERMQEFPIKVEVLNRFKTKKEQNEIIKKIKLGQIDIIIGTHRLLSKDVDFKDLGLLIIDEEHRFGVKAKEKIKQLKENIDVLTMTATPIPRTLHMSVIGIRDMSVIYEPPQNRKPVQTFVLEHDLEVVSEAIRKELERGGQVFYLFNNVEQIERKAQEIQELVPEAKVVYAHGQMTGKQIEDIMQTFVNGEANVLVCTTILESGIDIPNANTIIVENAERLGLAQLYQIRGRVGRSDKQAYAYIMYKRNRVLSEVADKRLKAIKEFTEFGSGFKVAMRDLEIRGAGSVLGEMQHGHLAQVGYDMYCKILDDVVKEMQGIEVEEEIDVQIDINVSSFIPDEFIDNSTQKIEIYQNIALCKNENDIRNVIDDIIDRYGKMPKEIENLLEITRIRNQCKKIGVIKIAQKNDRVVFYIIKEKYNSDNLDKLIKIYQNRIQFSAGITPYITYHLKEQNNVIDEVKEFLQNLE